MDLERFVAAADYVPADIVARDHRTQIVDLNRTPLAPHLLRDADLVTMLGVLEYLDDVDVHLDAIGRAGRPLLFSYCATDRHPSQARRDSGWSTISAPRICWRSWPRTGSMWRSQPCSAPSRL